MQLEDAAYRAGRIMGLLAESCLCIEIAGSIRREKAEVKDIEIVAIPKPTRHLDLLGQPQAGAMTILDELLEDMDRWDDPPLFFAVEAGKETRAANGPKFKKLYDGHIACDLFLAEQGNYGNILAIRTGSWEFGKWFMTKRAHGGAMPNHLRQEGGYLWHGQQRIECPTEEEFFGAIGLPVIPPAERAGVNLERFRRLLTGPRC